MTREFKILLADDDSLFATQVAQKLIRELNAENTQDDHVTFSIQTVTLHNQIQCLVKDPALAQKIDVFFCDLGWGDQNLAGIQLLNDFQLSHPHGFTVLYTAQNEDEIISQTLEWKLNFIDRVIKIEGSEYFDQMLNVIFARLEGAQGAGGDVVCFKGSRMISHKDLQQFKRNILPEIKGLHERTMPLMQKALEQPLDLLVLFEKEKLSIQFRRSSDNQQRQRYAELLGNLQRFPHLEPHELLPISKAEYLKFVQEKYGRFPEMAKQRGLDLNHIYRVNRRFKNLPIIVFQKETIQEILGIYDVSESQKILEKMLAPQGLLKCLL